MPYKMTTASMKLVLPVRCSGACAASKSDFVREVPPQLLYNEVPHEREDLSPEMLALEAQLDDELTSTDHADVRDEVCHHRFDLPASACRYLACLTAHSQTIAQPRMKLRRVRFSGRWQSKRPPCLGCARTWLCVWFARMVQGASIDSRLVG